MRSDIYIEDYGSYVPRPAHAAENLRMSHAELKQLEISWRLEIFAVPINLLLTVMIIHFYECVSSVSSEKLGKVYLQIIYMASRCSMSPKATWSILSRNKVAVQGFNLQI